MTTIEECRERTLEVIAAMTTYTLTLQTRFKGESDDGWIDTSPDKVVWNWSLYDYRWVPKTDHRVEVMQAYLDGKAIEVKSVGSWRRCYTPLWNWDGFEYRVAPLPDKTFEESVRAHIQEQLKSGSNMCGCSRKHLTNLYRKLFNEEP